MKPAKLTLHPPFHTHLPTRLPLLHARFLHPHIKYSRYLDNSPKHPSIQVKRNPLLFSTSLLYSRNTLTYSRNTTPRSQVKHHHVPLIISTSLLYSPETLPFNYSITSLSQRNLHYTPLFPLHFSTQIPMLHPGYPIVVYIINAHSLVNIPNTLPPTPTSTSSPPPSPSPSLPHLHSYFPTSLPRPSLPSTHSSTPSL